MKKIYFTNETPKERFYKIEFEFGVTNAPWVTVITLKSGAQLHGFFHHYPDSDELAKEFKLRFVIQNKSMQFRDERDNKKYFNPDCSEVVNAVDVAFIELVNPHLIKN